MLTTISVLALSAAPAHAGLGDMIKKKAAQVVKGDKPKPAAAAAAETGAITSRIQPPVTPENLAKFKASMELEIAEREKAKKFLATVKTPEAYDKCKTDWMMSPDGQKVSKEYMDAVGSVKTSEDMQKVAETIGPKLEKKIEEKCGPDPGKFNESWKVQQAREALGRASDQFAHGDDYAYGTWKEWVVEFCNYVDKLKKDPDDKQKLAKIMDEGLRIPGQGSGIYYVYTASEAKQLLENCESLMPLITATY
jgi:hypothetical protein